MRVLIAALVLAPVLASALSEREMDSREAATHAIGTHPIRHEDGCLD